MNNKISKEEQEIISKILNLNEIKLDILSYINENAKILKWEIDAKDDSRFKYPIGKRLGYIHFPNINTKEYLSDINEYILSICKIKEYKIQGLLNWILLIDRAGDLHDEDQIELISELVNTLELNEIKELDKGLIESFNAHYKFNIEHQYPKDLNEWRILINSASIYYPFDYPIDTYYKIIYLLKDKINIFCILQKLNPAPRASLIFHGIGNFINQSENDIIGYLENNKTDIEFLIYMLLDNNNKKNWVGESLISKLLKDKWNEGGKWLFRASFSPNYKYNSDVINLCKKGINSYLIAQFTEKGLKDNILKMFDWPTDFEALGGWLKEYGDNVIFNDTFFNGITSKLAAAFDNIRENIPKYSYERTLEYDDWFRDAFDPKSQIMTKYLLWALQKSSEGEWSKLYISFKKLCYELKTLFYSSYGTIIIAKKLTNKLIILITSLNIDVVAEDRLKKLIDVIVEIVSFPWIRFTEREEAIWNNNRYTPNYIIDSELIIVIKNIKSLYFSDKKELYDPIFKSIEENSTINWPIYE